MTVPLMQYHLVSYYVFLCKILLLTNQITYRNTFKTNYVYNPYCFNSNIFLYLALKFLCAHLYQEFIPN